MLNPVQSVVQSIAPASWIPDLRDLLPEVHIIYVHMYALDKSSTIADSADTLEEEDVNT